MSQRPTDGQSESTRLYARLRSVLERSGRAHSTDDVVRETVAWLLRNHHRGTSEAQRQQLRVAIVGLAEILQDLSDPDALSGFCEEAIRARTRVCPRARFWQLDPDGPAAPRKKQIESFLLSEYGKAISDADAVQRAVTRTIREKRRGPRQRRRVALDANDPLRGLLGLSADAAAKIPRADIRHHLAGKKDGMLRAVLSRAANFSESQMRPILGEEIWALGRVVGFADSRGRKLLFEVASSSLAQELAMRKPEILRRLEKVRAFENVRDIVFHVTGPSAL